MSLVNGYRVKCSSYQNIEKREKSMKQREENLGNWAKQKNERLAKLHKLQSKAKGGKENPKDEVKSNCASSLSISVIEGKNADGYTRLEDIPGDISHSTPGSVTELREYRRIRNRECC
eukprot:TRINITY_DN25087_c0_g1_i2.p2 TRINITY_DN25087_c0_g1~~TRINITY_DN25087_c0_g1_i2.p2  ORF type:complete len:118 (-),score=29.42 TRINITY_DN25087_c0_g1_i2:13-366(-)